MTEVPQYGIAYNFIMNIFVKYYLNYIIYITGNLIAENCTYN